MNNSTNSFLSSNHGSTDNEDWASLMQQRNKLSKNDAQVKGGPTPCRFYQLGQCSKGAKCSFMHKKASHFTLTQCKFFVNGFCRNGDRCPFSHLAPSPNRRKSSSDLLPAMTHKNDLLVKTPTEIVKLKQKNKDHKNLNGSLNSKNGYNDNSNGIYGEDASTNGHHIHADENDSHYLPNDDLDPFFLMDPYSDVDNAPYYEYSPEPLKRHPQPQPFPVSNLEETEDTPVPNRAGSLPQSPLWNNLLSPDIWGSPFSSPANNSQPLARTSQSLPESIGNWGDDNSFFSFSTNSLVGSPSSQRSHKASFLSSASPRTKTLFNTPLDVDEADSLKLLPRSSPPPQNDKSLPISIPNHKLDKVSFTELQEGSRYYYREQAISERSTQTTIYTPYPVPSAMQNAYTPYSIRTPPETSTVYIPPDEDTDDGDLDIEFDELLYTFQASIFEPTETFPPYIPSFPINETDSASRASLKDTDFQNLSNSNGNLLFNPDLVGDSDEFDSLPSTGITTKNKNKKKKTPKKNKQTEKKNSPENSSVTKEKQLCTFYLDGNCRYGLTCRNIHGNICSICTKAALVPMDEDQNEKHTAECYEKKQLQDELEQSKYYKCEHCKQKVLENNKRFGLLTECTHCFCLQCIKDWRSESQKSECPVCNVISHFVVPSNVMVIDKGRKNSIIQNYKEKMKQIPCKYFDGGKGTCKFGSNCHYAHVDNTNNTSESNTAPLSLPKPCSPVSESVINNCEHNRTITDSQGEAVPVNTLNLGMFLTYNIKQKEQNKSSVKK